MQLNKAKNIHFSGIKGVGMTALALYAQDLGIHVTGSDVKDEFVTQDILNRRKISITTSFSQRNVPKDTDALIFSAARPKNPQVKLAKANNIPTLSYAQALANMISGKQAIAVCGVGGKTTTAAMTAAILSECGFEPSFVIGVGNVTSLGVPGKAGKGKHVVVEADDYASVPQIDQQPKFLYLSPNVIVVTNIEHDHPDIYKNLDQMIQVFVKFFLKLPQDGTLIANSDNQNVLQAISLFQRQRSTAKVISYGTGQHADWKISNVRMINQRTTFSLTTGTLRKNVALNVPGDLNAQNACAALIASSVVGVPVNCSLSALQTFSGTKRRFEKVAIKDGIEVWDDYAHHPIEIIATLKAAKKWFPSKRIIAVFQPHTYSRTKTLLDGFSKSFSRADLVIITDIYSSAREKKDSSISASMLVKQTSCYHENVKYIPKPSMLKYLRKITKRGDLILTLGAGDIYKIAELFAKE